MKQLKWKNAKTKFEHPMLSLVFSYDVDENHFSNIAQDNFRIFRRVVIFLIKKGCP